MYVDELFYDNEIDKEMIKEGIGVSNHDLKTDWFKIVTDTFNDAGLSSPESIPTPYNMEKMDFILSIWAIY